MNRWTSIYPCKLFPIPTFQAVDQSLEIQWEKIFISNIKDHAILLIKNLLFSQVSGAQIESY